jgi:hypothetical protein
LGSATKGTPWASDADTVPWPACVTVAETDGSTAACGTKRRMAAFAGTVASSIA